MYPFASFNIYEIILSKMLGKIGRLSVLAILSVTVLLAVVLLAFSYVEPGVTDEISDEASSLSVYDLSTVPQAVVDDATRLAQELFGETRGKYQDFIDQLLSAYLEARDKDFLVIFNSGGWGWNLPDSSPGWSSILNGIESELNNLGYKSLLLNYQRTSETLWGRVKELIEMLNDCPSKAKDLAGRVEFLTTHIPNLRIIVAGESNGAVISGSVMNMERDNTKVYSIETGPPFWYKPTLRDRTLLLTSNGTMPDTFSYGDIPAIVLASVKGWLGLLPPEENPGNILCFLRAPGHDYSWQYPEVYLKVVEFLSENFGIERR